MSDPRWQRLWQHFDDLVGLDAEQRGPVLEQLTASDQSLATEVRKLLEAHDHGTSPLDQQAPGDLADLDQLHREMQLGPWRLESLIGRGGMGQVWRGHRDDGQFEQRVAIKFPGISGSTLLATRFEQERQTLARLNHPHIAHLLDGGTTAGGQPYLVMEWIDGQPITSYCQSLSVQEIMDVFVPVCRAADHAHRQLILHRDIKPANILVTNGGQAKLVDFGIAKSLTDLDQAAAQTQTALAFTAEYAAPEQIRGEAVGTPADVHALGAVLYELLSGEKPFQWTQCSLAHIIETATHQTPPPPSTRINNGRRRKQLRGDLDRVVLKALHRSPERRYPTAAALADDLNHWLRRRPVSAQADSTGYRVRKFVSRHPQGVFAGALALSALLALTIGLGQQTRRLSHALDDARQQSQRAQMVSSFLGDLFSQASPEVHGGEPPSVRELLEQGVTQIERAQLGPAVTAKLKQTMGRALVDVGELEQGRQTLLDALSLTPSDATTGDRAAILSGLGLLSSLEDDSDRAIEYQQQALQLLERAQDESEIRVAKAQLAGYWQQAGDRNQARQLLEDALTGATDSGDADSRAALASARVRLGAVHWGNGRFDLAQQQYELAHNTVLDVFGDHHPRTANSFYALGTVQLAQGHYAESEGNLRRALELRLTLFGTSHPLTAVTQSALGSLYYQSGKSTDALPLLRAALATEQQLFGEGSVRLGRPLNNLALVEHDLGQFALAEQRHRLALALYEKALGDDAERLLGPLGNLALLALDRQSPQDALPLLIRAQSIANIRLPESHPSKAFIAHLRGRALFAIGQSETAIKMLQQALDTRRGIDDGRHPHVADTLIWMARVKQSQISESIVLAEEAWQISLAARGDTDWRTLDYQFTLGGLLRIDGQIERGTELQSVAVEKLRATRGANDWRLQRLLGE